MPSEAHIVAWLVLVAAVVAVVIRWQTRDLGTEKRGAAILGACLWALLAAGVVGLVGGLLSMKLRDALGTPLVVVAFVLASAALLYLGFRPPREKPKYSWLEPAPPSSRAREPDSSDDPIDGNGPSDSY